jgi:hypothetical protein
VDTDRRRTQSAKVRTLRPIPGYSVLQKRNTEVHEKLQVLAAVEEMYGGADGL